MDVEEFERRLRLHYRQKFSAWCNAAMHAAQADAEREKNIVDTLRLKLEWLSDRSRRRRTLHLRGEPDA